MKINYSNNINRTNVNPHSQRNNAKPSASFATDNAKTSSISAEQANSMKAQRVCATNVSFGAKIPHIEEKDINFEVTCLGYDEIKGNTRQICDYRIAMANRYGLDWPKNFYKPCIVRNCNGDERINGDTTALVIPLNSDTAGFRGNDHAAIVFNGNISTDVLSEFVNYMLEKGILIKETYGKKVKYTLATTSPKNFFANPKVKTFIANFFKQKEIQAVQSANKTEKVENSHKKATLRESDVNISNIGQVQDSKNSRNVKDYLREFLKNDRKMTVVQDFFVENNQKKEFSAILIPSKKSEWDCITVTVDKKLTYDQCKDAINYLVYNKICNVENENFKKALVNFLNNYKD